MDEIPTSTHCGRGELMGNFGIFIQGILGVIAFSTLMLKRWREPKKQRRPWTIWFFDTSKQGFGALFIHFANVFLADAMGVYDPCTWYLISFVLDSTVGLLLIYLGLKLTQAIVRYFKCTTLYFGEYGSPPRCNAWIGQCALYLIVMMVEKVLVGLMVMPSFWQEVRKYMLSWIKDPHLEVILVMLVIPFLVNTIMFWVIDNFLMRKNKNFYGSKVKVTDMQNMNSMSSKEALNKSFKMSYRLARRTDSLDSSEDNASHSVRYHKILTNTKQTDKKVYLNSGGKNSDETLLLLSEDPEIPRGSSTSEVILNGKAPYFNDNSADSDNSTSDGSQKLRLLSRNVKRL